MSSDRPSPLISVDALAARLGDPGLVIADARWYLGRPGDGRVAYDASHIAGAIHLDLDADLADPSGFGAPGRHPLPDPAAFEARMAEAGIRDDTLVVAYDDAGGWVAARLWWMLDDLGHRDVAVLDGGWQAWLAAGLPTSTDVPAQGPTAAPDAFRLGRSWARVIARDELATRLGRLTLLDARGAPRYRGETEPIDPVAGHIPTAIHAPWDANLGPDGRFLPPDELRRRFADLATAGSARGHGGIVTSCGSGVSACHHALAMRIAGLPDPILYVGSYSDWTRSGLPVAMGQEPGTPPPDLAKLG